MLLDIPDLKCDIRNKFTQSGKGWNDNYCYQIFQSFDIFTPVDGYFIRRVSQIRYIQIHFHYQKISRVIEHFKNKSKSNRKDPVNLLWSTYLPIYFVMFIQSLIQSAISHTYCYIDGTNEQQKKKEILNVKISLEYKLKSLQFLNNLL